MLPKDQMAAYKEFWGRGSGSRLDREIRHSWSELRDMWLRTAADARDGISIPKAWKTLPKAKKALKDAGWKVHCAVLFRCSGQYVVQLKDDRVWMSFPDGPVLFSIDRVAAEFSGDALSYSIF